MEHKVLSQLLGVLRLDLLQQYPQQRTYQFQLRFILKLIKKISPVLQKLFRCFNGTIISRCFVPLLLVLTCCSFLILNELIVALIALKAVIVLGKITGSSLQYHHKTPNGFEKLSPYSRKLYIGFNKSKSRASSTSVSTSVCSAYAIKK